MSLTFKDYEQQARSTVVYGGVGHLLSYTALGLCGEAGEVAEKVKKCLRDHGGVLDDARREDLAKELGDVLWYLAAVCREAGVSLEVVAEGNVKKLKDRKDRGKLHGVGDER